MSGLNKQGVKSSEGNELLPNPDGSLNVGLDAGKYKYVSGEILEIPDGRYLITHDSLVFLGNSILRSLGRLYIGNGSV